MLLVEAVPGRLGRDWHSEQGVAVRRGQRLVLAVVVELRAQVLVLVDSAATRGKAGVEPVTKDSEAVGRCVAIGNTGPDGRIGCCTRIRSRSTSGSAVVSGRLGSSSRERVEVRSV